MRTYLTLFIGILGFTATAQVPQDVFQYEPSVQNPWGLPNPSVPEITQFEEMIGTCDCKSLSRSAGQPWGDTTDMVWKFKYIMNGTAVQDEVWRTGERYAGSIRQYRQDSAQWIVTYFSNPGVPWNPAVWHGERNKNEIILYREQKAPNGMDGFYKIRFYELSESGYNWEGAWVNTDESIVYPTWKIFCEKRFP